jgi:hypothetical protein
VINETLPSRGNPLANTYASKPVWIGSVNSIMNSPLKTTTSPTSTLATNNHNIPARPHVTLRTRPFSTGASNRIEHSKEIEQSRISTASKKSSWVKGFSNLNPITKHTINTDTYRQVNILTYLPIVFIQHTFQ